MQLQKTISLENSDISASLNERVRMLCGLAKEYGEAGDLEAGRNTLSEFWERVGDRPRLQGLDDIVRAELLLRVGTLSGGLGSVNQIEGAQAIAKDLISESARIFENLGLTEKVAEAQNDLAVCYWREGALDEARVILRDNLTRVGEGKSEQRLRALANMALLETVATRYQDALRIQKDAAPLFQESSNHALRGNFHNVYAQVLKYLGLAEGRQDHIDQAFIEFAASSYHFEQAGHTRYQARVENNVAMLLLTVGNFFEAHEHLDRARSILIRLGDKGTIAQVDESRARVLLAEGRTVEAERLARGSVGILEEGDQKSSLAEALITHATALARLERNKEALSTFTCAMTVAEQAGDLETGGIAALTIIEELGSIISPVDLPDYYRNAESKLTLSQHQGIQLRLGQCARRILIGEVNRAKEFKAEFEVQPAHHRNGNGYRQAQASDGGEEQSLHFVPCSLDEEVLRYEGGLIKRALETAGGSVTRAARLLGITHQGLAFILNGRHKNLLSVRTPVKSRRRSIIRYR